MSILLIFALICPQPGPGSHLPENRCLAVTRTLFVTDAHSPRRLILNHPKGKVRITAAAEARKLVVQARLRNAGPRDNESEIGLKLTSHNGTVTLTSRSSERIIDLDIRMPGFWNLRLGHGELGDIFVHGLEGEMEIHSQGGNLHLESAAGPVLASSEEGNITAAFSSLPADTAMAIVSVAGRVTVSLPADASARVLLRSRIGRIRTDFPISGNNSGWAEVRLGNGGSLIRVESKENQVNLYKFRKKR